MLPKAADHRRPDASNRGSTLLELMIGLVILSILMGIALPGLGALIGRFYGRSAAEDLLYAADLARSRARAQRVAYTVSAGNNGIDGELLNIVVRRGQGTACSSADATNGEVLYTAAYTKNNATNNPEIAIMRRAPNELLKAGALLCFKPDGRVVRADTEQPFSPPASGYLAGDAWFELSRVQGTTAIGDLWQVKIGYNGSSRLTFGHDLAKLKGGG